MHAHVGEKQLAIHKLPEGIDAATSYRDLRPPQYFLERVELIKAVPSGVEGIQRYQSHGLGWLDQSAARRSCGPKATTEASQHCSNENYPKGRGGSGYVQSQTALSGPSNIVAGSGKVSGLC